MIYIVVLFVSQLYACGPPFDKRNINIYNVILKYVHIIKVHLVKDWNWYLNRFEWELR